MPLAPSFRTFTRLLASNHKEKWSTPVTINAAHVAMAEPHEDGGTIITLAGVSGDDSRIRLIERFETVQFWLEGS